MFIVDDRDFLSNLYIDGYGVIHFNRGIETVGSSITRKSLLFCFFLFFLSTFPSLTHTLGFYSTTRK